MRNMQSPDGFSDHINGIRKVDTKHYIPGTQADQLMLDYLIDSGFLWDEAVTLLNMREHLYDNPEMRQRMEANLRIHFVKWLYEQGLMSDE